MTFKLQSILKIFGVCIVCFSLVHCGTGGAFGGFADASNFNDIDSDLQSDGPIDLPITIAKLQTPNIKKLGVSVQSISTGNLVDDEAQFQSTSLTHRMTVTGSESAVIQENLTPQVWAYYVENGNSLVSSSVVQTNVNTDGSFQFSIDIPSAETPVAFTAVDPNNLEGAPFLFAYYDSSTDVTSLVTTNSSWILSSQNVATDDTYYYLGISSSSGQDSLIRKQISGEPHDILAQGNNDIRIVAARAQRVAFIDSAGALTLAVPSESFYSELTTISSFNETAVKIDLNSEVVILNRFGSTNLIEFYNVSDGDRTTLIGSNEGYTDLKIAYSGNQNTLYVVYSTDGATYNVATVSLNTISAQLWASRTPKFSFSASSVPFVDVDEDGDIVIQSVASGQTSITYYACSGSCTSTNVNSPSSDSNTYSFPRMNSDGTLIVMCSDNGGSGQNQFAYFRPGTDSAGSVNSLTGRTDDQYCRSDRISFEIDTRDFLHFLFTPQALSTAQHSVINMRSF